MPYVDQKRRARLDLHIRKLANLINYEGTGLALHRREHGLIAGDLNYSISRLVNEIMPAPTRYWMIALVTGVLQNVSAEFYRVVVAPYEEKQRKKSGNVFSIEEEP